MKAYVMVFDHPFFATTAPDGSFEIKGVPAGEQSLVLWQEKVGYVNPEKAKGMSVTVRAGEVTDVGRGVVKTPPLWHTAAKMPAGRWYTDGSFHGPFPLMASSMELEKDRSFDALVRDVVPTIKEEFDSVIRHLRPPRYPYEIDFALAARGRELFNSQKLGCSGCHGVYDGRGYVKWPGVHVDVGTDRSRIDVVSEQFIDAFNRSPLATDGALEKSRGYAATPLTGVWANYPYLHNGSVPTLYHLLGPASERPKIFQETAARTLDRVRLGQPLYASLGFTVGAGEQLTPAADLGRPAARQR
jgi:hypothetical protein